MLKKASSPALNVGKATKHDSADRHVRGNALYIDDIREPRGTLHLAPGYARESCGKIKSLDLEVVRSAPGVVAVLTAADIPGLNDCSPSFGGDPILADDRIEFHGQVIFAVVAQSHIEARKAAKLARIEIVAETPMVTAEDGMARDASVLPTYEFNRGTPAETIKASPLSISDSFRIGGQEHFYLEGQVSLAIPQDQGEILVHTSTQHPTEIQHLIAKMLKIRDAAVVCECRRMGGAFGGKESQAAQWACLAALATHITGRPAKMRLDRDDDMIMTGKRHDFRCDWQAGFDEKGKISAVEVDFLARCGCSADLSLGVNDRTMFHADNSYYYPENRITSHRIKTNTVSNTAFRGFGGPQGMVFSERMMDAIAIKLGLDPLDVRRTNFYGGSGRDITPFGMKVEDNILEELVGELEQTSDYRKRRQEIAAFNAKSPFLKKGLALNPLKFGISFTLKHLNQAGALVHVYTDGSVQVNHGGTEMGQGLYTKVAQVVAEEFGIDLENVQITATTTDKVPNTAPTAASSGTDLNGMAAKLAAETIKIRLIDLAARLYQIEKSAVSFANNHVQIGQQKITFAELTQQAFLQRVSLSSTGYYATPNITWDRDSKSGRPFLYFAYGAACAEVTIDTSTGEMVIDRVDILHDVGKSLNPALDIGQIEGGFVQGMGWLTTEELVYDDQGRLRTHAPSTYKIPTASDLPEDFRVKLWDSPGNREDTIYRSKAVGEPPVMLATAVFSAITNAIASLKPGVLPQLSTPATPENILAAVKLMKSGD
ncbi:xanthine dehydrogenase molybdopterin binding subunit [Kiloniella laminariae]|uniref:Xanthine dehydrogenase molybdopterin binding subunit n=1 Tax=Kiloniella laminariae TaxID=454162 RepID=A0ABT4LGP3_9PROT|nr:xanthine dehydrogenase molybdopterin binding subunit [Kiloniella laminariae]MCZ4280270.1 xanthine dehydrogenase molybdopterin binding subunit [Kiloniella laminariae]